MRWLKLWVLAISGAGAVGCGDSAAGGDPDAAIDQEQKVDSGAPVDLSKIPIAELAGAPGCGDIAMDAPDDGLQISMPVFVEHDSEAELCMLVLVKEALNLNLSDGRFTVGSHHALLERTTYRDAIPTETILGDPFPDADRPHRCSSPGDLWETAGVIAGGQDVVTAEAEGPEKGLPNNVAYKIEAGEVLLLNFHMINISDADQHACYKINLHGIPDSQMEHEAGTFFYYNPFITLPAGETTSARYACPVTEDVTLLGAVSHMHSRGVASQAKLWDGDPTDTASSVLTQLYDDRDWEAPLGADYGDGMKLKRGQWIDWNCDYENPEARDVSQGLLSTDEMCMFIGSYYPRNLALEECGQFGFTQGKTWGHGELDGQEVIDCAFSTVFGVIGSGDDAGRYAAQECFTKACPPIASEVSAYWGCVAEHNDIVGCEGLQADLAAATCD